MNTLKSNEQKEREIKNFKIYAHVNKTNGKVYIGQTQKELSDRFGKNGIRYKGQVFYKAILKYGWNNFEHILLFDNLTSEMANILEIELINKYKTTNGDYGYNVSSGGNCVENRKSAYAGKYLSVVVLNRDLEIIDKCPSVETTKKKYGKINMNYNRKPYFINKDYIFIFENKYEDVINSKKLHEDIRYYKGARRRRPVICMNNLLVFGTTKEAGEYAGVSQTMITECCQNKRASAGSKEDLGKLMWEYYNENEEYEIKTYNDPRNKQCMCITTNEIFNNVNEASKKYGINVYTLYTACGKSSKYNNTHGGNSEYTTLTWKYV